MGVYKNNSGTLDLLAGGTLYADNPIGSIVPFGGDSAPNGWLLCQGQAISRTTYAELFAVIGTSFGAGNGSTTFNIPDLRGEFLRGAGTNSHSGQGNGGTVGTHQNSTIISSSGFATNASHIRFYGYTSDSVVTTLPENFDATTKVSTHGVETITGTDKTFVATNMAALGTVRPTNTSVNYIIKALHISLPSDFDSAVTNKISANVIDSVTNGNMKAVTSNAVYDGLALKQNKLVPTTVTGYSTNPTVFQNIRSITRYGNLVSMSVCFRFDNATPSTSYDGITGLPKAVFNVSATSPNEYGNAGTCYANIAAGTGTLTVRCTHSNNYYYINLVYFTND